MSCSSTAPRLTLLLFLLLGSQSAGATDDGSFPDFDFPVIDGSAVDTCRIFPLTTPTAPAISTLATSTISREKQLATTRKPTVGRPSKKAAVRKPPIRKQPAPRRPISGSRVDSAARLLHRVLAAGRGRAGGSPPGPRGVISQPSGSESDEAPPPRRAGRRGARLCSSEDSSDE